MGNFTILFRLNGVAQPPVVRLRSHQSVIFTLIPRTAGIVTFSTRSKRNLRLEFQPQERTVFVRENANSSHQISYFDILQVSRGTLKKGCCSEPTATYTCPNIPQTIVMKSAYSWSVTGRGSHRAPGIVHAEVNNFSLPVSIAGYLKRFKGVAVQWRNPQVCAPCDSVMPLCDNAAPYNATGTRYCRFNKFPCPGINIH